MMIEYGKIIVKNIIIIIGSVFLLSIFVFGMARLAPGDPLVSYYGERAERMKPEEKQKAMERLGLNDPIVVQYGKWVANAFHGDFGISYKYKEPVLTVISQRIKNTVILGGGGILLTFVLALLLAMYCIYREGEWVDTVICKLGTITSCIPEFWLSLMLILIFSVNLKLLPSSGAYGIGQADSIMSRVLHTILPMVVVVMSHLWYYAYLLRNRLREEAGKDYVLYAKAKGLSKGQCMRKHILRPTMPFLITMMTLSIPHILAGTYIVEMVFSYPGLGTLSFESAKYHDYNMLMVLCLITGTVVIGCNRIGEFVSQQLDPRMRRRKQIEKIEEYNHEIS